MSTNENTATDKRDVYARVTAQIINAIEQGVGNWRMPWHTSGRFAFSPINVTSKKPYRGINTVCLWAAAQAKGLRTRRMGHVPAMAGTRRTSPQGRKGHHGSVLEVRQQCQPRRTMAKIRPSRFTAAVHSRLLRVQCRPGGRLHAQGGRGHAHPGTYRTRGAFFSRSRARCARGNHAYYSPDDDTIQMPPFAAFFTSDGLLRTLAHETRTGRRSATAATVN